jgi:hypothetical protein
MNKAHRCLLHLACITIKLSRGQPVGWHWQHLIHEFGFEPHLDFENSPPRSGRFHLLPHPRC